MNPTRKILSTVTVGEPIERVEKPRVRHVDRGGARDRRGRRRPRGGDGERHREAVIVAGIHRRAVQRPRAQVEPVGELVDLGAHRAQPERQGRDPVTLLEAQFGGAAHGQLGPGGHHGGQRRERRDLVDDAGHVARLDREAAGRVEGDVQPAHRLTAADGLDLGGDGGAGPANDVDDVGAGGIEADALDVHRRARACRQPGPSRRSRSRCRRAP